MSREILEAMTALAREKGISPEKLMTALEDALLSAYKKLPGAARYARVEVDHETGDFVVIRYRIPKDLEAELIGETIEEESYYDPETGEKVEPQDPEIDPAKFEQYRDRIEEIDDTPEDFGRIAAQTAKQVILQRIREAERDMMFEEFRDRVGELITGIVQQSDSRYTLVQLRDRVEALLPKGEQVDGERYDHGQRVKAVIKEVSPSTKGPSIIVSRRDGELIKKLFELEVPEIADGLVEIANVAREPGYRSKIAVVSHADGVDPVGACVGPRGSRVRMVVSELRGEKIDIIPYNDEPARFVAKALSPARVREVLVDDESKQATVIVPDDQLSLAIGREGQNARLAARLTGWRIDIKSETDFAQTATQTDEDFDGAVEEVGGRCQAISVRGRRCPNEALPGSPFCGLPKHQALSRFTTAAVAILEPLSDEEIADLSDPDKTWDDVVDIVTRAEELYGDQEEIAVDESAEPEEGEFDEVAVEDGEIAVEEGEVAVEDGEIAVEAEVAEEGLEPAPEAAEPDGEVDSADATDEAEEPAS
ncbi:MAG TPA: transcription termination factor NusA [Baekduia sp.]|uniref:transcription termination factor NusA n=1 Tax=Baekduia sp. TaxID=2600305 RepID=UPI002D7779AC|nr:transcription termination factor NusA [Baekduia sp.]HET6505186.1 transcription termination factor NusA [Baekduia sp.]